MFDKLEDLLIRFEEIMGELHEPTVTNNQERFRKLMKEQSDLQPIVDAYREYKKNKETIQDSLSMLEEEKDEDMREMLKEELSEAKKNVEELEHELKILLLPKDPNDNKNVIVEIRAGAGGEEAALFAAEIYRMYVHYAERRGWKVEAVEKNPQAREFAKEHFGLEVKPESALQEFAPGSFDVITLWHVMEHLEHLNETWEMLRELLTEKGMLIVAVPNCSSYDAGRYGEYWAAYDVPRHLWHFTPVTIQQLASRHGFIMAARHPMPFDAFYVSMLSEKHRGSSCSFLKGMYVGTLAWFSTLGRKERSSSMIYVFRKKR